VDFERTRFTSDVADYPFRYADQDVLNAILSSRVEPERVLGLEYRLAPMPPFLGLELIDERSLRCAYEDGIAPYVLHYTVAKRWLDLTISGGVYARLLRRALNGNDVAIRLPRAMLPLHMRSGPLAYAERRRGRVGQRLRWRLGMLRRRLRTLGGRAGG
jgi:hypothetical protein